MFDNNKEQKSIPTSVRSLYVHGKRDRVVPFEHGRSLYISSVCDSKDCFWIEDGTHNNIDSSYRGELLIRVSHFLAKIRERW